MFVDLAISSFVDQLSDALQVRIAVCDVWVDDSEHFLSSLGQTDEDTIVDLKKSEKLEDLPWLGCDFVDTLDSNDENEFGLLINVEVARLSSDSCKSDLLPFLVTVLLHVLLGSLEDDASLLLIGLEA